MSLHKWGLQTVEDVEGYLEIIKCMQVGEHAENRGMTWSGLVLNTAPREMAGIQANEQVMEARLGLKSDRGARSKRSVCRAILANLYRLLH